MFVVESYAAVRRFVFLEGHSRREAARVFGLSRDTIAKMCRYSAPPGYVRSGPATKPKLGPLVPVIEAILEAAGAPDTVLALRDRALLEVLYGTGARISEAVGLDVDDVGVAGDQPGPAPGSAHAGHRLLLAQALVVRRRAERAGPAHREGQLDGLGHGAPSKSSGRSPST